jgi:putative transposase
MSHTVSPSSNKPYGVARVVGIWGLARSSFYAARRQGQQRREARKRGPRVASDEELITEIRRLLDAPVFAGEGYRKIWARLRHTGGPDFERSGSAAAAGPSVALASASAGASSG